MIASQLGLAFPSAAEIPPLLITTSRPEAFATESVLQPSMNPPIGDSIAFPRIDPPAWGCAATEPDFGEEFFRPDDVTQPHSRLTAAFLTNGHDTKSDNSGLVRVEPLVQIPSFPEMFIRRLPWFR